MAAVAVTADLDAWLHAALLEAGFQWRLARPVACEELVAALRALVGAGDPS